MFVLLGLIPQAEAPRDNALTWLEARAARRILEPAVWLVRVADPESPYLQSNRDVIWHPDFSLYPRGYGWWGLKMNGEPLNFEGLYVPYRGRLLHMNAMFTYGARSLSPSPFPYALEEFIRE